jgi:hypothetical protein
VRRGGNHADEGNESKDQHPAAGGCERKEEKKREREKNCFFFFFFSSFFLGSVSGVWRRGTTSVGGCGLFFVCVHDVRPKERRGLTRQETNEKKNRKKSKKIIFFSLLCVSFIRVWRCVQRVRRTKTLTS